MSKIADARIAELEGELVRARVRISYLESQIASQPANHSMVREVVQHVDTPTAAEMARLYTGVTTRWPRLAHPQPERGLQLFASAFSYMSSSVSHADKRSMFSAGSWVDRAEAWLRARHRPAGMSYAALAAASVALGIGYSGLDGPAYSWNLWAIEGSSRLPGSTHWHGILQGQPLRAPMPSDVSRRVMPERVVIRCGEGDGRPVETW